MEKDREKNEEGKKRHQSSDNNCNEGGNRYHVHQRIRYFIKKMKVLFVLLCSFFSFIFFFKYFEQYSSFLIADNLMLQTDNKKTKQKHNTMSSSWKDLLGINNVTELTGYYKHTATTNNTNNNILIRERCPLDIFNHDDCIRRAQGTVCIFPFVVLKFVKRKDYYKNEIAAYKVLNNTRFFPRLLYHDKKCLTMIQENVTPHKKKENNRYSANISYYKDFYVELFDIFNTNYIYPKDLNVCCNTLIDGENIRVIDFGLYHKMENNKTALLEKNKMLLEQLLKDIVEEKQFYEHSERIRIEKEQRKKEKEKQNGNSSQTIMKR